MKTSRTLLVAAAACIALAGCSSRNVRPEGQGNGTSSMPPPGAMTNPIGTSSGGQFTPADLDTDTCLRQRVVYFDLDQDTIKPEFQATIACHAKYLMDRPMARMTLQGNTDERGSHEYNLGLGERRGKALMTAIEGSGASASQMQVVSYGKERPICTESNEECWSRNRRVEIVYTAR